MGNKWCCYDEENEERATLIRERGDGSNSNNQQPVIVGLKSPLQERLFQQQNGMLLPSLVPSVEKLAAQRKKQQQNKLMSNDSNKLHPTLPVLNERNATGLEQEEDFSRIGSFNSAYEERLTMPPPPTLVTDVSQDLPLAPISVNIPTAKNSIASQLNAIQSQASSVENLQTLPSFDVSPDLSPRNNKPKSGLSLLLFKSSAIGVRKSNNSPPPQR